MVGHDNNIYICVCVCKKCVGTTLHAAPRVGTCGLKRKPQLGAIPHLYTNESFRPHMAGCFHTKQRRHIQKSKCVKVVEGNIRAPKRELLSIASTMSNKQVNR